METQPGGEITQSGACPDVQDDVSSVSGFRDGCTTCIKFARPLVSSEYNKLLQIMLLYLSSV